MLKLRSDNRDAPVTEKMAPGASRSRVDRRRRVRDRILALDGAEAAANFEEALEGRLSIAEVAESTLRMAG